MKFFTQLIDDIAHAQEGDQVIRHLTEFFLSDQPNEDKDQALKLLLGQYPPRVITVRKLKALAPELTGFPSWLIDRSEQETGNFIKAFPLLTRQKITYKSQRSLSSLIQEVVALKGASDDLIKNFISSEMKKSDARQLLVALKLLTGTFHFQIAKKDIIRALAQALEITIEIEGMR